MEENSMIANGTTRYSRILILALFFVISPIGVSGQIVKWSVVDGGWCDLVYVPFPPTPDAQGHSSFGEHSRSQSPGIVIQDDNSIQLNTQTINQTVNQTVNQATIQNNPQTTTVLQNTGDEGEEGFQSLFNGQNLDGWIIQGMEKAGPKIEDGVMKVGGWDYWAVITKDEFKNFILRFDVMFDAKGNSGILIHTPKKEVFKSSFEIQMADDEGKPDPLKWPGSIFGHVAPTKNAFKPIGEWNTVEIKHIEPTLWVTVNGEIVQEGVNLSQIPGLLHKQNHGSIALQRNDYKKAAYYRNIRIKRLPD